MAKRVQAALVSADLFAVRVLDAFADDHEAILVGVNGLFDLGQELFFFERKLRQEDQVRRIGRVAALGDHGAGGDPTGGASHDFNDAAGAVVGGHAGHINADLHHGGGVVFDDRAVARAIVGVRQVVVDGLGHADDAHLVGALDGFLVDFMGGILRI